MTTLVPLPDWNAENWRDWQKMGVADGYHWHRFIPFYEHPMASRLAKETRAGSEPISQLNMRELSYLWAKDVVDRSIGTTRLGKLARDLVEARDRHEQNFQALEAGIADGMAILAFHGAKSAEYPIQLNGDDVELLRLLLSRKGVSMEPVSEVTAEAHLTLNKWTYYLARDEFPADVPVSYLIQAEVLPFLAELSLLVDYQFPAEKLSGYLTAKEQGFHFSAELPHSEEPLKSVLKRAVESGRYSPYLLRLIEEPHVNLVHVLYDYLLWSSYGQTMDPESEKDTFESMIENTELLSSLYVPENRARLFGLYGTVFPPL